MRKKLVSVAAVVALAFGAVSCAEGGPSAKCVDWDHDKVTKTVTPKPNKTWNSKKKKWVTGSTPKPYVTTSTKVECEEWETLSPTPTSS